MTDITWISVFIDHPETGFETSLDFWSAVTGFEASLPRGDQGQYRSLNPPEADAHLWLQRVGASRPGVHVDLHVDAVDAQAARAAALGAAVEAEITDDDGRFVVMRTPAGTVFCLVPDRGERQPAAAGGPGPVPISVDQVSIDVPAEHYRTELDFWVALTGFEPRSGVRDEFTVLLTPAAVPVRLLLHRLGPDDGAEASRAHLDLAAGLDKAALAEAHVAQGAQRVADFEHWIVMRDPVGMIYCLTGRDPGTGTLPS